MFATAVRLLARTAAGGGGGKAGPVKVSNLGEQVQPAAESLFNILQAHGPLTAKGCWQHASQLENTALRSKRQMKLMLRWMREKRRVKITCNATGKGPTDKEFLFSLKSPKIVRNKPSISQEETTV
ncbi:unnamed protein product [Sphagnum jensenii]|uniref:Uncharacterized protein n=1 Tax=Sphagnum jensenii TaxID=128206 RepID=A0ABP0WDF7_9BRYO